MFLNDQLNNIYKVLKSGNIGYDCSYIIHMYTINLIFIETNRFKNELVDNA